MRVLFVNRQFGSGCGQGTERYLGTLGACLGERGHEVSYLAGDPTDDPSPARLGHQVSDSPEVCAYPTRGWMSVAGLSARRLEAWLRGHRPDVVHLANPAFVGIGAMRAGRRLGIPVVVTIMDFWWVCPKTTLLRRDGNTCDGTPGWEECVRCLVGDHARRYVRWLAGLPRWLSPLTVSLYFARAALRGMSPTEMWRWLRRRQVLMAELNSADQIIFPSRAVCDVIGPRLTHDRWRTIPYGLSREWFAEAAKMGTGTPPVGAGDRQVGQFRGAPAHPCAVSSERVPIFAGRRVSRGAAEANDDQRPLTIGFAGTILPHKAPHLLLAAVKRLGGRGCRIRLAGAASDPGYLGVVKAAAEGLDVEFVGALRGEQMPAFLRSLDVLAMTSVWPENLPFVVLEAQAAGVPVVGSKVAGVAEQIADSNLLFEPGSVEGLAAALAYVREHRGRIPAAKVSTAEEMTDATEAVYREAGGRRQKTGDRKWGGGRWASERGEERSAK